MPGRSWPRHRKQERAPPPSPSASQCGPLPSPLWPRFTPISYPGSNQTLSPGMLWEDTPCRGKRFRCFSFLGVEYAAVREQRGIKHEH